MDAEVESRGRSRCDTANSAAGRTLKMLSMTQKGVTYFNELYSTWFLPMVTKGWDEHSSQL